MPPTDQPIVVRTYLVVQGRVQANLENFNPHNLRLQNRNHLLWYCRSSQLERRAPAPDVAAIFTTHTRPIASPRTYEMRDDRCCRYLQRGRCRPSPAYVSNRLPLVFPGLASPRDTNRDASPW